MPQDALASDLWSLAQALFIGLLIGVQREAAELEPRPGVRDFLLLALTGAVCGIVASPWLTVAALLSLTAFLVLFHIRVGGRTGITTEIAGVLTFCLGYLAATPAVPEGGMLAIGTTIVVAALLEAKRALTTYIRESMSEGEFNGTLGFLAIIFLIYPILPPGSYGPYEFFTPRLVWIFVILVSSISFAGYFVQKLLGGRKGLKVTAVFGGLASTTAATAEFARKSAEFPGEHRAYWQAVVIANTVQFPRLLAIMYAVNPDLAWTAAPPLLVMTLVGTLLGLFVAPSRERAPGERKLELGNPFRLGPALKFGLIFTLVLFLSRAGAAELGGRGVYWSSAIGGSLDVDAVVVSLAELLHRGEITGGLGRTAVLLALLANALLKSGIAAYLGTRPFARGVWLGFLAMYAAGFGFLFAFYGLES